MRTVLCTLVLAVVLGASYPAEAQLRSNLPDERAPVKLFDDHTGFSLNQLFSPEHFRMSHSYEMSFSSWGGSARTLGQYTNTMMWQFNDKLAARIDVAFMHSPFGQQQLFKPGSNSLADHIYLRNAEIAYRPSERIQLHFSVRQSPYGRYMSPYGRYGYGYYGSPYGYYGRFSLPHAGQSLFWNDLDH